MNHAARKRDSSVEIIQIIKYMNILLDTIQTKNLALIK